MPLGDVELSDFGASMLTTVTDGGTRGTPLM